MHTENSLCALSFRQIQCRKVQPCFLPSIVQTKGRLVEGGWGGRCGPDSQPKSSGCEAVLVVKMMPLRKGQSAGKNNAVCVVMEACM